MGAAWAGGAASWPSAGALEPPPKKPPMACPMEEPTATPLDIISVHSFGSGIVCAGGREEVHTLRSRPSGRTDPSRSPAGPVAEAAGAAAAEPGGGRRSSEVAAAGRAEPGEQARRESASRERCAREWHHHGVDEAF